MVWKSVVVNPGWKSIALPWNDIKFENELNDEKIK
jgi:hypothetical protein